MLDLEIRWPANLPKGRTALVALLLAVYGGTGWLAWSEMSGRMTELRDQRQQLAAAMGRASRELRELEEKRETLERKRDAYEAAQESGFLGTRDRLDATRAIERLASSNNLNTVDVELRPQVTLPGRGGHGTVTATPIIFKVSGLLDRHIYAFMADLKRDMPGLVLVRRLEVRRAGEITPEVIERVRAGELPDLVTGTVEVAWAAFEVEGGPS